MVVLVALHGGRHAVASGEKLPHPLQFMGEWLKRNNPKFNEAMMGKVAEARAQRGVPIE